MRSTLLGALLIAASVAFVCQRQGVGAEGMPTDLAAAVKRFDEGQTHNDVAALTRLVADDYVLVNSDASVENKKQYLADFGLPGFKIEPYTTEQPVETVWNGAAVVAGLVYLRWTQDGERHVRPLRIAHVWAKRDGRWQLVYTQVTRVPG